MVIPINHDGKPKKVRKSKEIFEYLILREYERLKDYDEPVYLISGTPRYLREKSLKAPGETFNVNPN